MVAWGASVLLGCADRGAPAADAARASAVEASPLAGLAKDALAQRLEARGAAVLESFRKRAAYHSASVVSLQEAHGITLEISVSYALFVQPREKTAKLRFLVSPQGELRDCSLQDPLPFAVPAPCPWLLPKLARVLASEPPAQ